MKKFYTAKYDRVFKTIFCNEDNKELMMEFLSRTLGRKVENLVFLRNELEVRNTLEQVKTVDVFALVDGEYIHIELNTGTGEHLHIRNFNYFTALYNKKIKRGERLDIKSKFLHIDFTYGLGKNVDIKNTYQVASQNNYHLYIKNFEIVEYNMDKIMELWYHEDKEEIEKYKHLIMLDLETSSLKELGRGDKFMEEFEKKITDLNEDETFQSWMTREEDQIVMFNTEKEMAYESGMREGELQGLTKGIEQGISEGISRGVERNKLEVAKNMLKKGLEVSLIMEITGLTKEEIEALKD